MKCIFIFYFLFLFGCALTFLPPSPSNPPPHTPQSVRTGLNAMSAGDVGRCVIVLISDGRANVPLDVSNVGYVCVCVCVCMYVCMCVCMYVCIYVCVCMWVDA
jgi:hypothetical protein